MSSQDTTFRNSANAMRFFLILLEHGHVSNFANDPTLNDANLLRTRFDDLVSGAAVFRCFWSGEAVHLSDDDYWRQVKQTVARVYSDVIHIHRQLSPDRTVYIDGKALGYGDPRQVTVLSCFFWNV